MKCGEFDPKDVALGELKGAELEAAQAHLAACAKCRALAEEASLTVSVLRLSPDREIPRRIAFVSDPVLELSWWQRFWRSGPQVAFASAGLLSAAILFHAFAAPGVPAGAPAVTAAFERRVSEEVAKRLPGAVQAAVDSAVEAKVRAAVAGLERRVDDLDKTRLASLERRVETERRGDLKNLESAFNIIERRLAVLQASAVRYGGDD